MTDVAYLDELIPDEPDEDPGAWAVEPSVNGNVSRARQSSVDPASFAARIAATRVDLVERIRDGIPPIDYLPASDGMLVRGKRHQIPAPKKSGKSLTMLVHWTAMVEAGARVVILDRENGANLYAARLEGIIAALNLDADQLAANLTYYEFPRLRKTDGDELARMCAGADVVVFDSQRMFLTDLGLTEDGSDDYSTFMHIAIDPLFRAGIATVILDNTGHEETGRSRGSAAKGDLNEVIFKMEVLSRFNLERPGRVKLTITDSRFGTTGAWEMAIGGGNFETWQRTDDAATGTDWKPTVLMQRVFEHLNKQAQPVSRTSIVNSVSGNRSYLFEAVSTLVEEGTAYETTDHLVSLTVPDGSSAVPGTGGTGLVPGSRGSTPEPRNRSGGEAT
jgi:hypothetical protein